MERFTYPFRSIRANKWRPRSGVVDDDEGRGRRWKKKKGNIIRIRAPSGLWVYAIKNVNICRRLVIGCKYGGRPKRQMGGVSFQLLCFVIYWNVGHSYEGDPRLCAYELTRSRNSSLTFDPASRTFQSIQRGRGYRCLLSTPKTACPQAAAN